MLESLSNAQKQQIFSWLAKKLHKPDSTGGITESLFYTYFSQLYGESAKNAKKSEEKEFMNMCSSLSNPSENWKTLVDNLQSLANLSSNSENHELFVEKIDLVIETFCKISKNLRSQVIKEMCFTFAFISINLGLKYENFICCVGPCFAKMLISYPKIVKSAIEEALTISLSFVHSSSILEGILTNAQDKAAKVRKCSIQCISTCLEIWPTEVMNDLIPLFIQILQDRLGDSDQEVRQEAKRCCNLIRVKYSSHFDNLYVTLDKQKQKMVDSQIALEIETERSKMFKMFISDPNQILNSQEFVQNNFEAENEIEEISPENEALKKLENLFQNCTNFPYSLMDAQPIFQTYSDSDSITFKLLLYLANKLDSTNSSEEFLMLENFCCTFDVKRNLSIALHAIGIKSNLVSSLLLKVILRQIELMEILQIAEIKENLFALIETLEIEYTQFGEFYALNTSKKLRKILELKFNENMPEIAKKFERKLQFTNCQNNKVERAKTVQNIVKKPLYSESNDEAIFEQVLDEFFADLSNIQISYYDHDFLAQKSQNVLLYKEFRLIFSKFCQLIKEKPVSEISNEYCISFVEDFFSFFSSPESTKYSKFLDRNPKMILKSFDYLLKTDRLTGDNHKKLIVILSNAPVFFTQSLDCLEKYIDLLALYMQHSDIDAKMKSFVISNFFSTLDSFKSHRQSKHLLKCLTSTEHISNSINQNLLSKLNILMLMLQNTKIIHVKTARAKFETIKENLKFLSDSSDLKLQQTGYLVLAVLILYLNIEHSALDDFNLDQNTILACKKIRSKFKTLSAGENTGIAVES